VSGNCIFQYLDAANTRNRARHGRDRRNADFGLEGEKPVNGPKATAFDLLPADKRCVLSPDRICVSQLREQPCRSVCHWLGLHSSSVHFPNKEETAVSKHHHRELEGTHTGAQSGAEPFNFVIKVNKVRARLSR